MIKEKDVKYVDFRFTDTRGKWQHTAQHVSTVDEDMLNDGIQFDGSSLAGWKEINESDMTLKPDLSTAVLDPFPAQTQLILFCDVIEPATGLPYDRCPRSIAKKALAYAASIGIADTAFFGPEAEFFIFDDVKFSVEMNKVSFQIDADDAVPGRQVRFHNGAEGMNGGGVDDDVQAPSPADGLRNDRANLVGVGYIAVFHLQGQTEFRRIASQLLVSSRFDTARCNLRAARSKAHRNRAANSRGTGDHSDFPRKFFHKS